MNNVLFSAKQSRFDLHDVISAAEQNFLQYTSKRCLIKDAVNIQLWTP